MSLGVKLLVADELLVTVSLGGGGVGSAERVLIADDDLVIPKLLDELGLPVEDLDRETLREPVELIDPVFVVVIVEVDDPDTDDVLLFVTVDVIVEDDEDVFERYEDPDADDVSNVERVAPLVADVDTDGTLLLLTLEVNEPVELEDTDLEVDRDPVCVLLELEVLLFEEVVVPDLVENTVLDEEELSLTDLLDV